MKKKKSFIDKDYNYIYTILDGIGTILIIISLIICSIVGVIKLMPTQEERYAKEQEKILIKEKEKQKLLEEEAEKKRQEEAIKEAEYQRQINEMNLLISYSEEQYRNALNNNELTLKYSKELVNLKIEVYTSNKDGVVVYRLYNEDKNLDKLITFDIDELYLNLIGIEEITTDMIKISDIMSNNTISIKVVEDNFEIIKEEGVNPKYLFTDGIINYSEMKNFSKNVSDIEIGEYLHDMTEEEMLQLVFSGDEKYRKILKDAKSRKDLKLIAEKHFNTFSIGLFYNKEEKEMVTYITGNINGVEVDRVVGYRFRNNNSGAEISISFKDTTVLIYDVVNRVSIFIDLAKDKEPISIDYVAPYHYEGFESLI